MRRLTICLRIIMVVSWALSTSLTITSKASGEDPDKEPVFSDWGQIQNGLQCRIAAVDPGTDEQSADGDSMKGAEHFQTPEEITFLVELKNNSIQPIKLVGTRYDNSETPPGPGKSNSDRFGPLVFKCSFVDLDGVPLEHPTRELHPSHIMSMAYSL